MIKAFLTKMLQLFSNLSIRTKLMVTFFILIILPLSIFSLVTYHRISNQLRDQTLVTGTLAFNKTESSINTYFSNMITASSLVLYDNDIYDIVNKDMNLTDTETQLHDYNTIINKFNYLQKTTNVDKISIYLKNDFPIASSNNSIYDFTDISSYDWYQQLIDSQNNRLWYSSNFPGSKQNGSDSILTYLGVFYNNKNFSEVSGILKIDISSKKITSIMSNSLLTSNSFVYLCDSNQIILSTGKSPEPSSINFRESIENKWNLTNINSSNSFVIYTKISGTPWYLVSIIPEKDLYDLSIKIRNEMLLLMLVISIVSYLLAYIISRSSLNRITRLTKEIKKVESGNLSVSKIKSGQDEIGIMINSFGKMVLNLSQLIDEKYKMGQEIKNSELKALQAQINPHFLYNTLDLINCIAIKNNVSQITTMVHSLAKFYKISLSNGADIIKLIDELTHASLYVQIQNMRFSNRISFEVNVDESLYNYSILKIILQPIIENSIIHGILEKPGSTGKVIVSGYIDDNILILRVEDDGVGMPPEKVDSILSSGSQQVLGGYGVKNINDRIRLYYGNQYGLRYTSSVGNGTCVEIRIPAVRT